MLSPFAQLTATLLLTALLAACGEGPRMELKERPTIPEHYYPTTIARLLGSVPIAEDQPHTGNRLQWSAEGAADIDLYEPHGAVVQAYVIDFHFNPIDGDMVLTIAEKPDGGPREAVIVEATRNFWKLHTDWSLATFKRLASQRAAVRISGWLFYDNFHTGYKLGSARGTLWEIHPVTKIEVLDGVTWNVLE